MKIIFIHVSHVMCHEPRVTCHVSRVACNLSLAPTSTARDLPYANSSIMHSRLVHKDPKPLKKLQNAKNHLKAKIQKNV